MVELLTVIGIIVILIGFLFVAVKYAKNSAARSHTHAQLETLRNMLAELDAANKFSQSPPSWLWYDAGTATPPYVVGSSGNTTFWGTPFYQPAPSGAPDSLDAPGDVRSDTGPQQDIQRNASFAILNTQLAMQMLAAIPDVRATLDKLPADAKMLPTYSANAPLQATVYGGSSYVGLLKDDGTDTAATVWPNYVAGTHVSYGGHFYTSTATPPTAAPGGTGWYDETSAARGAPILLDGWGNPIIFVPGTGLHVKMLNGQGKYLPADPPSGQTQEWILISPEGHVTNNGTANPYVDRIGRPFFASAGADGDFTHGDSVLCSFNN